MRREVGADLDHRPKPAKAGEQKHAGRHEEKVPRSPPRRRAAHREAASGVAAAPAASTRRHDVIAEALVNEILAGTLKPGMTVDERSISLRFGVSRTPVRQAIAHLQAQGLIEVRPRSGSYVASVTLSEVLQLFELVGELEATCAKYAATRMDDILRVELRGLAEACERTGDASHSAYSDANTAFHDLVYRGSGNAHLEATTRGARRRVAAYRRYTLEVPGRITQSAQEHFRIVEAIEQRDPEGAYHAMRDHMDIQRDDFAPFVEIFERSRGPDHRG